MTAPEEASMAERSGDPELASGCALAWSGGKDATLALHRARQRGYRITRLFSIYEGNTGRTRFHGIRRELLEAQARSLDLPLLTDSTHPDEYETVFGRVLDRLRAEGIGTVVFGNIHLEEIREWFESRTRARGFDHVEPLWGDPSAQLVREFLTAGYRTLVVSVNLDTGDPSWLGRELDGKLVAELLNRGEIDPCGERGEYHSFAFDGPLFTEPVRVERGDTFEREGHRILDLSLPPEAEDGD